MRGIYPSSGKRDYTRRPRRSERFLRCSFYHQFVNHSLATWAAADTVLHVLTVWMATSIHNQTHFCIKGVVPGTVTINHPHSSIQPLIEPGAVALGIVNPRDLTVGTVPAFSDFCHVLSRHGLTHSLTIYCMSSEYI